MPFSTLKEIIFRIVPNSGGNDLATLRREFSEENLARIMAKLAIGQRLGQAEEFMGKDTPQRWAQPYERLLLLAYVLEHEQAGQSLQTLLSNIITALGKVQMGVFDVTYKKNLAKVILAVLPDLLQQLDVLIEDANLTVLSAMRELCDGFEILQENTNHCPKLIKAALLTEAVMAQLARLNQFQIQLAQRIAVLRADHVIQPDVQLELVPVPPLLEPIAPPLQQASVENTPDGWSFQQAASRLLAYSFGITQNVFECLSTKHLVTLLYMVTHVTEWWQPTPSVETTAALPLLMPVPEPESSIDIVPVTPDSEVPEEQNVATAVEQEVQDELPELSQILRNLRQLQRQAPTLAIRIAACEQLCRALVVIRAEASDQRKPALQSWQSNIQECLARYRGLEQNPRDSLEDIDQVMRNAAMHHTEGLRRAYRGHYDNHFEKLCICLFNFIKQVFQCSTLAKVQRLNSRCTMFAQAGGVPVGAPSLPRSDSRISLLSAL